MSQIFRWSFQIAVRAIDVRDTAAARAEKAKKGGLELHFWRVCVIWFVLSLDIANALVIDGSRVKMREDLVVGK